MSYDFISTLNEWRDFIINESTKFISNEWRVLLPMSLSIFALTVSIYLYFCSKKKYDLTFTWLERSKIHDEEILLKYCSFNDIYGITFKIENSGTLPFEKNDFKKPIIINFGDDAKILDVKIVEKSKDLEIEYNVNKNEIIINETFFNLEEFFIFETLVDNYTKLDIKFRISGIKTIHILTDTPEAREAALQSLT